MKNIKKYTQDQFIVSDEFEKCQDIYLDRFFLEDELSFEDISGVIVYTYTIEDDLIGFGTYQPNSAFYLIDIVFNDRWRFSDKHSELFNFIKNEILSIDPNQIICLYQTFEDDCKFYLNMGFNLYKDYGQFFKTGQDVMRFVLDNHSK